MHDLVEAGTGSTATRRVVPAAARRGDRRSHRPTLSVQLVDSVLEEAFDDLLHENRSAGMRSAIAAIEERLDEQAWRLRTEVEAGRSAEADYHAAWQERHPTSRAAIEDVINHVHLEDRSVERGRAATLNGVAEHLTAAWRGTLRAAFAGHHMRVEVHDSILTAFSSL
jgi:hypothetical protein